MGDLLRIITFKKRTFAILHYLTRLNPMNGFVGRYCANVQTALVSHVFRALHPMH